MEQLYQKWNITDRTDFASMRPEDYPILSDLYDTIQDAYDNYDAANLYPREMLRDLLLGLRSHIPTAGRPVLQWAYQIQPLPNFLFLS